jgi:hypothetical protein
VPSWRYVVRLIIYRSIDKVIGKAHRYFIALHNLPKLTIGYGFSVLGAGHHKPVHWPLNMYDCNLFCGHSGRHGGYHKGRDKETASFHQIPRVDIQLM